MNDMKNKMEKAFGFPFVQIGEPCDPEEVKREEAGLQAIFESADAREVLVTSASYDGEKYWTVEIAGETVPEGFVKELEQRGVEATVEPDEPFVQAL